MAAALEEGLVAPDTELQVPDTLHVADHVEHRRPPHPTADDAHRDPRPVLQHRHDRDRPAAGDADRWTSTFVASGSASRPRSACLTRNRGSCSIPTTGPERRSGRSRSARGSPSPPCRCSSPTTRSPTTGSTCRRPRAAPRSTPRAPPDRARRGAAGGVAHHGGAGPGDAGPGGDLGDRQGRGHRRLPRRRQDGYGAQAQPGGGYRDAQGTTTTSRASPGFIPPTIPRCRSSSSSTSRPRRRTPATSPRPPSPASAPGASDHADPPAARRSRRSARPPLEEPKVRRARRAADHHDDPAGDHDGPGRTARHDRRPADLPPAPAHLVPPVARRLGTTPCCSGN